MSDRIPHADDVSDELRKARRRVRELEAWAKVDEAQLSYEEQVWWVGGEDHD